MSAMAPSPTGTHLGKNPACYQRCIRRSALLSPEIQELCIDRSAYPESVGGRPLIWEELNHIRRVRSIANLRYQESVGDSLLPNRLVPSALPAETEQLDEIRAKALSLEDYLLAFYSADTEYGAILIQTDFGTKPVEGFVPAVDAADVSLDDSFANFDEFDGFALEFDESVEVQEIEFEAVDMLGEMLLLGLLPGQSLFNDGVFGSWLLRYSNSLRNGDLLISSTLQGDVRLGATLTYSF